MIEPARSRGCRIADLCGVKTAAGVALQTASLALEFTGRQSEGP